MKFVAVVSEELRILKCNVQTDKRTDRQTGGPPKRRNKIKSLQTYLTFIFLLHFLHNYIQLNLFPMKFGNNLDFYFKTKNTISLVKVRLEK